MQLDLIGNVNIETKTYHKIVYYPTQVFHYYQESIGISKHIIETRLKPYGIKYIKILVKKYPNEPNEFIAFITLEDFIKHSWDTTGKFHKKRCDSQLAVPLAYFKKIPIEQKVL